MLGALQGVVFNWRTGTADALAAGASALGRGGAGKHEALLRKLRCLEASHRALVAGERCQVGQHCMQIAAFLFRPFLSGLEYIETRHHANAALLFRVLTRRALPVQAQLAVSDAASSAALDRRLGHLEAQLCCANADASSAVATARAVQSRVAAAEWRIEKVRKRTADVQQDMHLVNCRPCPSETTVLHEMSCTQAWHSPHRVAWARLHLALCRRWAST